MVGCLACGDGPLKPDVVFFGETVPRDRVDHCFALVDGAGSLLVLGSSLTVMSGYRFVLRAAKLGHPGRDRQRRAHPRRREGRRPGRRPAGRGAAGAGRPPGRVTREVERTDDGRYVVVDGRRWRTADPALPDDVRERLLHHLGVAPLRRADGGPGRGRRGGGRRPRAGAAGQDRAGGARHRLVGPGRRRPGGPAGRRRCASSTADPAGRRGLTETGGDADLPPRRRLRRVRPAAGLPPARQAAGGVPAGAARARAPRLRLGQPPGGHHVARPHRRRWSSTPWRWCASGGSAASPTPPRP